MVNFQVQNLPEKILQHQQHLLYYEVDNAVSAVSLKCVSCVCVIGAFIFVSSRETKQINMKK